MRDYILLYINGKEHRIGGDQAFVPITDYLRYDQGACGTKVVCAEGDCGACTALIGRVKAGKLEYQAVNACIQFVYQLDCAHVITVEGLKLDSGELNAVQRSMVDCHGAQCGYCTPGFIVAMCGMFNRQCPVDKETLKEELTGNLCRCTGYESIVHAGLSVDSAKLFSANKQYPPEVMTKAFKEHMGVPVKIVTPERTFFNPVSVGDAVRFKADNAAAVIVSGGTDVSVNANKRGFAPTHLMSTSNLPGLDGLTVTNNILEVGARVTLRELEAYVHDLIPEFYKMLWIFGSPQIRCAGTLAGNIANGSPIGDTLPFLFVVDAEVEVAGVHGVRRINMNEMYKGYKTLALKPDELITRIFVPVPQKNELLKLYKVSKREQLDISSFGAAIKIVRDKDKIASAKLAYGGVAAVVLRLKKTEEFLNGKPFSYDTFSAAGVVAKAEITPLSDVRGSSDFRLQLAQNILLKFFHETAEERELACL